MSVLARELDAYQRAVDQYNRSLRTHNKGVDSYNESLVRGPDGEPIIVDKNYGLIQGQLPPGQTPYTYGRTELGTAPGKYVLRQNPTATGTESVTGAKYSPGASDEGGVVEQPHYYTVSGADPEGNPITNKLGPEWRVTKRNDFEDGSTFDMERDANTFQAKPGDFTKTLEKAPQFTLAELHRAQMPSLAAVEAGLIGEAMRGSGLKSGVRVQRSNGTTPDQSYPGYRPQIPRVSGPAIA